MLLSITLALGATMLDPANWARTLGFVAVGSALFILGDHFWLSPLLAEHRQRQVDAARRARRRERPAPPGGAG